jgi:putative thioredoxin
MAIDVTDETFETEVIERSRQVPVVVDLWAPWCGPCRTLGPILEKVTDETGGQVTMVKVNIDDNPQIAQAFGVQSIPLVVALKDGQPVDGFLGAQPEQAVRDFIAGLLPSQADQTIARLLEQGDESSLLQALDLDPGNEAVVVTLAELWVRAGRTDEALALLARVPETAEVRRVAALARVGIEPTDDYDQRLADLLPTVKTDDEARQAYVDLLELMGPEDPRTGTYRKKLTAALF